MAQVPTAEEAAQRIIAVMATRCRGGEAMNSGQLQMLLFDQDRLWRKEDWEAGLAKAAENGWVEAAQPPFLRLTDAGFLAA